MESGDGAEYAGLFGYIESPIYIGNICIEDCDVYGTESAGALAGFFSGFFGGGEISNCTSTGVVVSDYSAGGLFGAIYNVYPSRCYSYCNVSSTDGPAGGFCGRAIDSIAKDCFSIGDVSSTDRASGFCGAAAGGSFFENCYSCGLVTAIGEGEARVSSGPVPGRSKITPTAATTIRKPLDSQIPIMALLRLLQKCNRRQPMKIGTLRTYGSY